MATAETGIVRSLLVKSKLNRQSFERVGLAFDSSNLNLRIWSGDGSEWSEELDYRRMDKIRLRLERKDGKTGRE